MCLIFDRFASREQAEAFARAASQDFDLLACIYDTEQEAQEVDPIPVVLEPPIVHVARADLELEDRVEALVGAFGGKFAGT
jgi:hypothetical protein